MSSQAANSRPLKPGKDGKFIDAEDAAGVHVLDPLVHVVAARPHLVEGGGLDAVLLLGAAGDGVRPMLGITAPLKTHTSEPSGVRSTFGRRVGVAGRQAALEQVRAARRGGRRR